MALGNIYLHHKVMVYLKSDIKLFTSQNANLVIGRSDNDTDK